VSLESLVHDVLRLVSQGEEVSLASHETEQVVEEVINSLTLLDSSHEKSVKFLLLSAHFVY
jgi:hypothetical protein